MLLFEIIIPYKMELEIKLCLKKIKKTDLGDVPAPTTWYGLGVLVEFCINSFGSAI